jgi:uncharacterized membrane protein
MKERFWEIDFLRGYAIIAMVVYHLLFDLRYFAGWDINLSSGIFWAIGRSAAILFVFLVGVSMAISYSRNKELDKFLIRGVKVLFIALSITLVTWLLFPQNYIIFGVLHLIGLSVLLSYPFLKHYKYNAIIGVLIIVVGLYFFTQPSAFAELLWLLPYSFSTFDYFPIFPWFGLVLLGIYAGNRFYVEERRFSFKNRFGIIQKLGRHSLLIYLIHQPILVGLIYLLLLS